MQRIRSLMRCMGNPHQGIAFVHVAGTNGKGSTSLMISAILEAAGYRAGRFTSPHLHSYFERITVNGREIEGHDFNGCLDRIQLRIEELLHQGEEHPTEFEVLTALAFHYFAVQQVDVAVIETGLGGRYDSTNVIHPRVSVIPSIDYDHTAVLGDTLQEIAENKAGIIKREVPLIVGPVPREAYEVLAGQAAALQAPLISSSVIGVTGEQPPTLGGQEVNIDLGDRQMNRVWLALPGAYQRDNLACALAAVKALRQQGWVIAEEHIRRALSKLYMPGRLEVVSRSPLVLVDAAHNPHASRALAGSLHDLLPGRKRVLVCGMVDDKDVWNTLRHLGDQTRCCIVTRPQGERGSQWHRVYDAWQTLFPDKSVQAIEDIVAAVQEGVRRLQGDDYLLVTGSFYVLDRARRLFTRD